MLRISKLGHHDFFHHRQDLTDDDRTCCQQYAPIHVNCIVVCMTSGVSKLTGNPQKMSVPELLEPSNSQRTEKSVVTREKSRAEL